MVHSQANHHELSGEAEQHRSGWIFLAPDFTALLRVGRHQRCGRAQAANAGETIRSTSDWLRCRFSARQRRVDFCCGGSVLQSLRPSSGLRHDFRERIARCKSPSRRVDQSHGRQRHRNQGLAASPRALVVIGRQRSASRSLKNGVIGQCCRVLEAGSDVGGVQIREVL